MGRPKRKPSVNEVSLEEFNKMSRSEKMSYMRMERIPPEYLTALIMDYKFKKNINKTQPMPSELAEVLLIIIDKTAGSSGWRGYTDDWKEEFKGRAIEHVLKYAHGFDPTKVDGDPFNYFRMMIGHAFVQSWAKLKKYHENHVAYNGEMAYSENEWDEGQTGSVDLQTITPNMDCLDWGGKLEDYTM